MDQSQSMVVSEIYSTSILSGKSFSGNSHASSVNFSSSLDGYDIESTPIQQPLVLEEEDGKFHSRGNVELMPAVRSGEDRVTGYHLKARLRPCALPCPPPEILLRANCSACSDNSGGEADTSLPSIQDPYDDNHGWISNVFFLLGSVLYTWAALWDIQREQYWYVDDDDIVTSRSDLLYAILSSSAASCYVLDALRQLTFVSPSHALLHTTSSSPPTSRHGDHRGRTIERTLGITFGVAALSDLVSSLTVNMPSPTWSNATAVTAVHAYLVYAVILWTTRPRQPPPSLAMLPLVSGSGDDDSMPETRENTDILAVVETESSSAGARRRVYLQATGDLLFLVGSLTDAILSYSYNTRTTDEMWRLVDRVNLVSAILWLVNAVLYIVADSTWFARWNDGYAQNEVDSNIERVAADRALFSNALTESAVEVCFRDDTGEISTGSLLLYGSTYEAAGAGEKDSRAN